MSWLRPMGLHHLWSSVTWADCILCTKRARVYFGGFLEGKTKVKYLWETFCAAIHTITSSDWKLHYKCAVYQRGDSYAAADLLIPQPSLGIIVVSTLLRKPSLPHKTQVLRKARKRLLLPAR